MSENLENLQEKYMGMTPDDLIAVLSKEELSQEDKVAISVEMVKNIGINVAMTNLLTTTRYTHLKKKMKCVIEEDGEMYVFEMKKIADSTPEKGDRDHDRDISKSITISIDSYE